MQKEEWILSAIKILDKSYPDEDNRAYAESLYESYVLEDSEDWSPDDAIFDNSLC